MPTDKATAARDLADWVRDVVRNGGIDAKDVALGRDLIARYDAAREVWEDEYAIRRAGEKYATYTAHGCKQNGMIAALRAALEGGDDADA